MATIPMLSQVPVMFARALYGMAMGLGFNGNRDYYTTFGWNANPSHSLYVQKYLRQDVAQRVINSFPDAVWTEGPTIEWSAKRTQTKWEDLCTEHQIWTKLRKADIFAGLGQFSVLIIGIDDGKELSAPVNAARENKLIYLQPYLEGSIEVQEFETNRSNPRFGLPTMYRVKPQETNGEQTNALVRARRREAFTVHHSRVLHLADNTLENPVFGHSRLQSIYNVLDDLQKIAGGSAETFWMTANRGIHVDVDKDIALDEGDASTLTDEVSEYVHGLSRMIRTRGSKVTSLGSDVADPRGVFFVLMSLLSANTRIPQRVLMGAEAGQLASQQDRANWSNAVKERQASWAEPIILRPFVGRLLEMNVLHQGDSIKEITWAEAFKMNPLERGQTSAQQARSITNVARAMETAQKGQYEIISVEEAREMVAPGESLLVLNGTPTGTFPPRLSAPTNDPQNKLDEIEAQGDVAADAAAKAAEVAKENPPVTQPFGAEVPVA